MPNTNHDRLAHHLDLFLFAMRQHASAEQAHCFERLPRERRRLEAMASQLADTLAECQGFPIEVENS